MTSGLYHILSLRWTRSGEECVTWWGPNNSGYVRNLTEAGVYTSDDIARVPSYYDNKTGTLAVPVEIAEKYAIRVVTTDAASSMCSEVMKASVSMNAPYDEPTDDKGQTLECGECGHTPRCPGPSRLVVHKEQP